MKCNQTNKVFKSKVNSLSKEDGESLTKSDFNEGSQLLMEMGKKHWPVTVEKVVSARDEDTTEGHVVFNTYYIDYFIFL